jgi:phospholipid/cholesterol/gamma-HCH transport system substrate-binding protein
VTGHLVRARAALRVVLLALVLTGCAGPTFSSLPLPGSGVSGDTMRVDADFADVLNLADGAAVRVDGVDSGRVTGVTAHDFRARVRMDVRTDARLRAGATARLRYTTPLGELFVDIRNPDAGALLHDGADLPVSATSTAPTVEDTLASASLLINGGGLAQLETITSEANKALGGREGTVRDLLERSGALLAQVNASSGDIDRALRALDGVSAMLAQRRGTIRQALVDVRPAAKVLRANLADITALLATLERFAGNSNDVVSRTRDQVLTIVREAGPVLQELVSVRKVLPGTLEAIVRLADLLDKVLPGDYLNLGTHLILDKAIVGGQELSQDAIVALLEGGRAGTRGSGTGTKPARGAQTVTDPGPLGGLSGLGGEITRGVGQNLVTSLLGSLLGGSR